MSQSALADKGGTAETVEAEKKEALAPWRLYRCLLQLRKIQTSDYAPFVEMREPTRVTR